MNLTMKHDQPNYRSLAVAKLCVGDVFMLWAEDSRVFIKLQDEEFRTRPSQNIEGSSLLDMGAAFGHEYNKYVLAVDLKNNILYVFKKDTSVIKVSYELKITLPSIMLNKGEN